jgi:hypothetical protein
MKLHSGETSHIADREIIIVDKEEFVVPTHSVSWLDSGNDQWKPSMREGFSFSAAGRKGILFGGISNKKHGDMAVFDFQYENWKKIDSTGDKPCARNNHTAVSYRKMIYVFGGEKLYDEHTHTRECLSDIKAFNTETLEWKTLKTSGDGIEGRRGHACVVVGKNMLIFGGINSKGYYLDSLYHFDMSNLIYLAKLRHLQIK